MAQIHRSQGPHGTKFRRAVSITIPLKHRASPHHTNAFHPHWALWNENRPLEYKWNGISHTKEISDMESPSLSQFFLAGNEQYWHTTSESWHCQLTWGSREDNWRQGLTPCENPTKGVIWYKAFIWKVIILSKELTALAYHHGELTVSANLGKMNSHEEPTFTICRGNVSGSQWLTYHKELVVVAYMLILEQYSVTSFNMWHTTKFRLTKWNTKIHMAINMSTYVCPFSLSAQAYENKIQHMLDIPTDDESVCILQILITQDKLLPFCNYNMQINKFWKKIQHTSCRTLLYKANNVNQYIQGKVPKHQVVTGYRASNLVIR